MVELPRSWRTSTSPLLPHSRELSRPLVKLDFLQPHAFASSLLRPIPNRSAKERKQQKAIHRHSQRQTTDRRVVVSASVSVCTAYITVSGRLPPLLTQVLIPIAREPGTNRPTNRRLLCNLSSHPGGAREVRTELQLRTAKNMYSRSAIGRASVSLGSINRFDSFASFIAHSLSL